MINCYHGEIEVATNNGPSGGDGGQPDFAAVAAELGVTEGELVEALGDSSPPNFTAAAEALGISYEDLRAALPGPGQ